jgi:hypothetical protein
VRTQKKTFPGKTVRNDARSRDGCERMRINEIWDIVRYDFPFSLLAKNNTNPIWQCACLTIIHNDALVALCYFRWNESETTITYNYTEHFALRCGYFQHTTRAFSHHFAQMCQLLNA